MTKFNYIFTFLLVLLAFQLACGQTQNKTNINQKESEKTDSRVESLKAQAGELEEAFNKNDFEKFVELTHPKVIEKVGGKKELFSMVKNVAEQNPKIFESFSLTFGNPSALAEWDGEIFALVPQKIEGTTLQKHKVVQESCIVGISNDKGLTWKFISGEKFNDLFPALIGKIQIFQEKTFVDGIEQ